jgi:hypothetical protein
MHLDTENNPRVMEELIAQWLARDYYAAWNAMTRVQSLLVSFFYSQHKSNFTQKCKSKMELQ